MPDDANQELLNRTIRHAVGIERFKVGEVRRIVGILDDQVIPDLTAKASAKAERLTRRGLRTTSGAMQAVRELRPIVEEELRVAQALLLTESRSSMVELARNEAAWMQGAMEDVLPIEIDVRTPSPENLRAIVTSRPFPATSTEPLVLRDWWKNVARATRNRMLGQFNAGFLQGEGVPEISRRFRRVTDLTRRDATTIVRTAANHVSNAAATATAQENEDVVKGEQFIATLDDRTTIVCAAQDGRVYPVGQGPIPPLHHQCRSRRVVVLKSWKELGIPGLKEAPEGTRNFRIREGLTGQVPASTTYPKWLRAQPKAVQDEILGPGKAKLFRAGRVPMRRWTTPDNRPLTLKELKALDRQAMRGRKVAR